MYINQIQSQLRYYFQKFLSEDWMDLDSDIAASLLIQHLREAYKIPKEWSEEDARAVIGLRYELDLRNVTNISTYVFIEDISDEHLAILLELNIGAESTKTGAAAEDLWPMLEAAAGMQNVRVRGLMTIPPFDADRDTNMQYFREVRALYVDINAKLFHNELECISMGMSGDFADAIRAGATMVRVGTAIFGTRYYT